MKHNTPPDTSAVRPDHPTLRRSVGLLDLVMVGAASALGVSIFSVLGPAVAIGGTGVLITLIVAAVPMAVFGVVYAFLASADPRSGASFEWPNEYLHPFVGFFLGWLRVFGNVGQLTMFALVLVQYLAMLIPLPAKPAMLALYVLVCGLNAIGVRTVARAETVLMGVLLAALSVFVVTGIPHISLARIVPLAPHGPWPILLAIPLMLNLFMGIESSTEIGEEVRDAETNIPRAIGLSLLLIGAVYLAVTFVALGLVGPATLAGSPAPLITAAKQSVGSIAIPLILLAAAISLLKSMNATFLIFSRSLFAMGRAGVMPRWIGSVAASNGTPVAAIAMAFLCACVGLALPRSLVFLFLASNVPSMLKYLTTCACAWRVATARPEVYSRARLKLSRHAVVMLALVGMGLALGIFALGLETDWRPYALVSVWGLLGVGFWWVRSRTSASRPRGSVGNTL